MKELSTTAGAAVVIMSRVTFRSFVQSSHQHRVDMGLECDVIIYCSVTSHLSIRVKQQDVEIRISILNFQTHILTCNITSKNFTKLQPVNQHS